MKRIAKSNYRIVNDLCSQLYLLREALLNSFYQPIFYKELSNKLRLLVYEKENSRNYKPILLILADKYKINYKVRLNIPYPSRNYPFQTPGEGELEFRDYLNLFGFGREDYEVSIKEIIKDVANQMGGAHEDLTIADYLKYVSVQIHGIPYHLELAQELAVHTLRYGQKILDRFFEEIGRKLQQEDIEEEVLSPTAKCSNCSFEIKYDTFNCPNCNYNYIPQQIFTPLNDQFNAMLKTGVDLLDGDYMINMQISIPELFINDQREGILLKYFQNDHGLSLVRTSDFKLVFTRYFPDKYYSSSIDLFGVKKADWFFLSLIWAKKFIEINIGTDGKLHSERVEFL